MISEQEWEKYLEFYFNGNVLEVKKELDKLHQENKDQYVYIT